jgi:hypothetical protein
MVVLMNMVQFVINRSRNHPKNKPIFENGFVNKTLRYMQKTGEKNQLAVNYHQNDFLNALPDQKYYFFPAF